MSRLEHEGHPLLFFAGLWLPRAIMAAALLDISKEKTGAAPARVVTSRAGAYFPAGALLCTSIERGGL